MLSIFSYVSGPSVCLPWRSVCSSLLPTKRGIICARLCIFFGIVWYSNLLPIFFKKLGCFLVIYFFIVLYTLGFKSFIRYILCKYFFPSVACVFILLTVAFVKIFNFSKVKFIKNSHKCTPRRQANQSKNGQKT